MFGRGDGRDGVVGHQGDGHGILQFEATITPADLAIGSVHGGDYLAVAIAGTDEVIFSRDAIEQLQFSNGTTLDVASLVPLSTAGNDASQTIVGSAAGDILDGMRGNDEIDGREGNDHILGGSGNDLLIGGIGRDYLAGGAGHDTYVYGVGHGNDVISNADLDGSFDSLVFDDIGFDAMSWHRSGDDLLIRMLSEAGGSVLVEDWFTDSASQIDEIYDMDYQTLNAAEITAIASASPIVSRTTGGPGTRRRRGESWIRCFA